LIALETVTLQEVWNFLRFGSPIGLAFSFILGAVLGSFANVVIWRLPRAESLIKPVSHCPHCGIPIPPRYNIPILSFFILKGRSACCHQPIPSRYLIVELLCALIPTSLYFLQGWTADFLFASLWMILLVILAGIDLEHLRLPNPLVGFGAALSLLWMLTAPQQSWSQAGWGFLVGLGFSTVALLAGKIAVGKWSGFGDLKLAVVLGFTFGPGRFFVLYLCAALAALIYAAVRGSRLSKSRVPMGPFFALGTWVTIWCGEAIVRWYLGLWETTALWLK